jgi:hypothetical protein
MANLSPGLPAEVHTEPFPLLELPEALVQLVVSKIRAVRYQNSAICALASTSHGMLTTVLEACSDLNYISIPTPDGTFAPEGSATAARCISRLTFSAAQGQPSRARIRGSLMPGDSSARWMVCMPLHAMALSCAAHCDPSTQPSGFPEATAFQKRQAAMQCAIPTAARSTVTEIHYYSASLT